ncbi:putative LRR receptor-like serine/threonine-protein kinase [Apostasia shenzhenica]|uniref:Putative LRR receptor-like serine/threonine-protein kinase n=1 Tax=Apostasia shenzhenica TaxID=1088818 RepID=A0A2I0B9L0_9ASPA|nr:putative LRR receptor-like serine/threonine-protein kinase [Apostasia shenzhenica]
MKSSTPRPHFLHFFVFLLICLSLLPLFSSQQLSSSQSQALFRLRRSLENPPRLSSWNRRTSFCSLPPSPSLSISCSVSGDVTGISIAGDSRSPPLSTNFSSVSFFTTLSRFNSLSSLSLVSLGIWGPLPPKIKRLSSLKLLNLSSNYFNGSVPDLTSLADLDELDLSGNFFASEFPSLGKSIESLVLKNNKFRDSIPMNLASFDRLQQLDLSSNQFTGQIPPSLFILPHIRYLDLSENLLKGALPASISCGDNLHFVDVSRNRLVGILPSCLRSNSSNLIVLNSWNCFSELGSKDQHPSSYCIGKPLAAVLPNEEKMKKKTNINLCLILGVVGGIVGGAVVIALLIFFLLRKIKPDSSDGLQDFFKPSTPVDKRHMSQAVIIGTMGQTPYRVFTIEELDEATNGFDQSNLISGGPRGQFFKGWLQDGSTVLVRSLKLKQKISHQSLLQYLDVISKLRHRHLVSIFGHCIDTSQENVNSNSVFLVFEYVSNGTLRSHLTEWRKREMLKWQQRVTAVIGVARGIQFLHTVTVPGIVGNDLNIENILLDETLTAKISNYNLPVAPKNKNNKVGCESPFEVGEEGDFGSIQIFENGEREDIYQLGLILFEVITGKPGSASEFDVLKVQLQKSLNGSPMKLRLMADPAIRNTYAHESVKRAVELALNCASENPMERPSIDDVLWNLQYCAQIQDGWASSESLCTQSLELSFV